MPEPRDRDRSGRLSAGDAACTARPYQVPGGQRAGAAARRGRADGGRRADRAQQFMPFAALRGYYDLIRERERVVEPKRALSEEDELALSRAFARLERRRMARVVYHDGEGYVTLHGMVTDIDEAGRTLTVVRTRIPFDDILEVQAEGGSADSAAGVDGIAEASTCD